MSSLTSEPRSAVIEHRPNRTAQRVLDRLHANGSRFFTGVPCSLLSDYFDILEKSQGTGDAMCYIPATREDSAVGVASGLALAGERPVVLMQNSGLGYCLNVITSLNLVYALPVLFIIGWRGHTPADAPEHQIIGPRLTRLLDTFDLPWITLQPGSPEQSVDDCLERQGNSRCCSFLLVTGGE